MRCQSESGQPGNPPGRSRRRRFRVRRPDVVTPRDERLAETGGNRDRGRSRLRYCCVQSPADALATGFGLAHFPALPGEDRVGLIRPGRARTVDRVDYLGTSRRARSQQPVSRGWSRRKNVGVRKELAKALTPSISPGGRFRVQVQPRVRTGDRGCPRSGYSPPT